MFSSAVTSVGTHLVALEVTDLKRPHEVFHLGKADHFIWFVQHFLFINDSDRQAR